MCVCGTEVVTPFGDAVGFVYGYAGEFTLSVNGVDMFSERICKGVFRGDVQEAGKGVP